MRQGNIFVSPRGWRTQSLEGASGGRKEGMERLRACHTSAYSKANDLSQSWSEMRIIFALSCLFQAFRVKTALMNWVRLGSQPHSLV